MDRMECLWDHDWHALGILAVSNLLLQFLRSLPFLANDGQRDNCSEDMFTSDVGHGSRERSSYNELEDRAGHG